MQAPRPPRKAPNRGRRPEPAEMDRGPSTTGRALSATWPSPSGVQRALSRVESALSKRGSSLSGVDSFPSAVDSFSSGADSSPFEVDSSSSSDDSCCRRAWPASLGEGRAPSAEKTSAVAMHLASCKENSSSSATSTSAVGENPSMCGDETSLSLEETSRWPTGLGCAWISIAVSRISAAMSRSLQACAATGAGLLAGRRSPGPMKTARGAEAAGRFRVER